VEMQQVKVGKGVKWTGVYQRGERGDEDDV
jgi:hypothetical protein